MGDNNEEKPPDQEGDLNSKEKQNEDENPSFKILFAIMEEIKIENKCNYKLLARTSADIASLKDSSRAFQMEVRASAIMGDSNDETSSDQERNPNSRENQSEDEDSYFKILLTMMKDIKTDNTRNYSLLARTSVDITSLKDSFGAFQIDVRSSLVHITKTLDSLSQGLKLIAIRKNRFPVLRRNSRTAVVGMMGS